MNCEDVRPFLNLFLDREIEPTQRANIDSHLKTCVECAAELSNLEIVRRAIRVGMPYYKAPDRLRDQVRFALRGAEYIEGDLDRKSWKGWRSIAAAAAFLALASAPFLVNARNQSELIAEELLESHQRALVGRAIDVVSSDQHTVKPWFNGKVPFSPPVINLVHHGFPLEGGRLDYADGHPAATLVYSRRLHRIDVFVWPSQGEKAPPSNFQRNGFNGISWTQSNFVFTAVSDLNAAELTAFTRLLQSEQ